MELANTQPTLDIHLPERAVFVTDDNRRAKRLRRGALLTAAFACLWLVGLGVGMLGLGGLPGISLGKHNQNGADRARPEPGAARLSPLAGSVDSRQSQLRRSVAISRSQNQHRLGSQSRSVGTPARPVSPVPAPPVTPPAQQPVNPAQRQRGWFLQRGYTAPPGQVRKTQPPPPPANRGQHRGQNTTTTPTTPLPPGQAKKQPPPPPEG